MGLYTGVLNSQDLVFMGYPCHAVGSWTKLPSSSFVKYVSLFSLIMFVICTDKIV